MLHIIEGSNFVGKTSTLAELRKRKPSFVFIYHPRFNESDYFHFDYADKVGQKHTHVHRDVVYQISHLTCLKYLESFKDKNILLDRIFISEMVYNEYYNQRIYDEFVRALKDKFEYKIYYLTCDSEEELRKRINKRVEADREKAFGVRVEAIKDDLTDIVESRYQMQRLLDARYKQVLLENELNHVIIDTSSIPQRKVAAKIVEYMKESKDGK